jgi:hypothetical protein
MHRAVLSMLISFRPPEIVVLEDEPVAPPPARNVTVSFIGNIPAVQSLTMTDFDAHLDMTALHRVIETKFCATHGMEASPSIHTHVLTTD